MQTSGKVKQGLLWVNLPGSDRCHILMTSSAPRLSFVPLRTKYEHPEGSDQDAVQSSGSGARFANDKGLLATILSLPVTASYSLSGTGTEQPMELPAAIGAVGLQADAPSSPLLPLALTVPDA